MGLKNLITLQPYELYNLYNFITLLMIPQQALDALEELKDEGNYKEAIAMANSYLVKNPQNKEALYQVADIEYRMGKLSKSEKPVDFLIASDKNDPMGRYLKGVIAMEKTEREQAKVAFKKALKLVDESNPEMMRCYAIAEYRSGNKEKGLQLLEEAYEENEDDAEIILNLVELYIMEKEFLKAQMFIEYYFKNEKDMMFFDRTPEYYTVKLALFAEFIYESLNPKLTARPKRIKKTK
jgi:tetratricopeptide (TPR) repeat protein